MNRFLVGLCGCAALLMVAPTATAQGGGKKGGDAKQHQQAGAKGGGKAKHQHHNRNGKSLLGAKLKQDGKHAVGKFKNRDVTAEVKRGKVVAMAAGDIAPKRVRTKTKMASASGGLILASWQEGFQLAQYDTYYYGYCFDDGYEFDCYWYPAEEVEWEPYTWDEYDPYW
jgi:hypothetical protein